MATGRMLTTTGIDVVMDRCIMIDHCRMAPPSAAIVMDGISTDENRTP